MLQHAAICNLQDIRYFLISQQDSDRFLVTVFFQMITMRDPRARLLKQLPDCKFPLDE